MVPKLFCPREIWAPKNFVPENFAPCVKMPYNDFHMGTKFLGDKKGQGPNDIGGSFQL